MHAAWSASLPFPWKGNSRTFGGSQREEQDTVSLRVVSIPGGPQKRGWPTGQRRAWVEKPGKRMLRSAGGEKRWEIPQVPHTLSRLLQGLISFCLFCPEIK